MLHGRISTPRPEGKSSTSVAMLNCEPVSDVINDTVAIVTNTAMLMIMSRSDESIVRIMWVMRGILN